MKDCDGNLTEAERNRNIHGPMLQYDYCPTDQGPLNQPTYGQPVIYHVYCTEKLIYRDDVSFFRVLLKDIICTLNKILLKILSPDPDQ